MVWSPAPPPLWYYTRLAPMLILLPIPIPLQIPATIHYNTHIQYQPLTGQVVEQHAGDGPLLVPVQEVGGAVGPARRHVLLGLSEVPGLDTDNEGE